MTLTRRDLDQIRDIVRSELKRAGLDGRETQRTAAQADDDENDPWANEEAKRILAASEQKWRERDARPIPEDVLDTYDAARLADVMPSTVVGWMKRGWLTRRKVKGKWQIERKELEAFLASRKKR
jgi:hypothetical protein